MKEVHLQKNDTCLSYAMKRIGAKNIGIEYEALEDDFFIVPFSHVDKLEPGNLVMWDRNVERLDIPWYIDSMGRIYVKTISSHLHVAVYEGSGRVSDCSRMEYTYPALRMRFLKDIGREPDKVLILKEKFNE